MKSFMKTFFCRHEFKSVYISSHGLEFYLHSKCEKCKKEKYFKKNDYPPTIGMRG